MPSYYGYIPKLDTLKQDDVIFFNKDISFQNPEIQKLAAQNAIVGYRDPNNFAGGDIGLRLIKPYQDPNAIVPQMPSLPTINQTQDTSLGGMASSLQPPQLPDTLSTYQTQYNDLLTSRQKALEQRKQQNIDQINRQYADQRQGLLDTQNRSNLAAKAALARSGGLTSSAGATYLTQLDQQNQTQLQKLEQEKNDMISKANQLYEDQDFQTASLLVQQAQSTAKEQLNQQNQYFAQKLQLLNFLQGQQQYELQRQNQQFNQQNASLTPDIKEYEYAKQQGFKGTFQEYVDSKQKPQTTADITEYNLAKSQGYAGSFVDYQNQKQTKEAALPNSYKEWQLAGSPGTYADFLSGSGVSNIQAARDQALAIMAPNSTTTIKDVPVKQRFAVEGELNKLKNQALQSGDIYGVIRASAGGKDASDTFKQSFEKALNVIDQIVNLKGTIEGESTGPIWGILRSNNPYDTKAQQIKAQITAIVPNLARGVYGEVGVLTDNDVALYSKTLPSLKSTQEVSDAVLGITIRSVQRSIENKIKSQAGFGVDMSGIENVYREVKAKADELLGIDPSVIQAMSKQYGYSVEDITNLISGDGTNPGLGEEQTRAFLESQKQSFNPVGGDTNPASQKTGMRTDRHNNPTAFTTAIAEQAGLREGVDYVAGDPFPDNKSMRTATILGDPIETTIKVIDKIGFYTGSGKQRWTHTAIPQSQWNSMSKQQKIAVVKKMYEAEGGSGELLKNYA